MKKKVISLLIIFLLLFTNYAFAYTPTSSFTFEYDRTKSDSSVKLLNSTATVKTSATRIGSEYTAITSIASNNFNNKDFSSGNIIINQPQSTEECLYTENSHAFYIFDQETTNDVIDRYITIKFPKEKKKYEFSKDEFYIIFKDAVSYNNKKYNLKMELKSIALDFASNSSDTKREIFFHAGQYRKNETTSYYEATDFYPGVGASKLLTTGPANNAEINVEQTVIDDNGNSVPVSGFYVLTDLDLEQGIAIDGFEVSRNNVFMEKKSDTESTATETIKYYKKDNSNNFSTYIYSTTDTDLSGNSGNVYLLLKDKSSLNMTYTFGTKGAHSTVGYIKGPNYYSVETNAINGNITSSVYNLEQGDIKKIDYTPTDDTYYLKRITIDGVNQTLTPSIQSSYTFTNIDSNHTIEVEYAKKVTIQFDSKGGNPVPTQTRIPGETATRVETTRDGYTFRGWYTDENYTTLYNFENPVNEDIILYAKWDKNDVYHNITYIVLGEPDDNNATNPDSYKEGDTTKTITNPTKQGYTFSGWYENQNLTGNPVTTLNVTNRTDDITLYGRWTKNEEPSANYTVRHYLEDENGTITYNGKKYRLDENTTETKSARVNSNVTEQAITYVGYTAQNNSLNGTVRQDGSLTLDFYYDKIQYTVTFDTKGGAPVPNQQTKKYLEKVSKPTDPTKNGYNFLYWYEIINGIEVPYDFNTPVTSNKTLIAKWQEVIPEDVYHNIRYIIDGTADNSAGNPERFKEGSTTPLTIYNPTKHGYTFSGWYDNQGLNGNKITTLDVSNKTSDITLYGKWTKNKEPYSSYIVNHYLEDENGTVTKDNKKYKLDNTETKQAQTDTTVTENAHTYEGYEAEKSSISGIATEDGSLVLNFYYNKKQYKVTFDSKGGTKVNDQTKIYGEKVDEPENPTKDGYKFLYWYEEKDGKKVIYDFDKPVNSDKHLIAEWEEIKIIPDTPKENTVPTQKTDTTVAQKVIPNTGVGTAIFGAIIAIICAFFGIRYFKLRKDMK